MAKKKKTADETPAVVLLPPPLKNRSISKSFVQAKVERALVPEDYEKIQQAMVAKNREKADLAKELEERMSRVKEARKKISALSGEIEGNLLTIESGRISEERRCLQVKDMNTMLVSRLDPETGELFNQDAIPEWQRQRSLDFIPDPDDDCHSCKHIICRLPVDDHFKDDGGGCLNFADCHDCPNFKCGYKDYEEPGRCGFGKHLEDDEDPYNYPEDRDCDGDCFFCPERTCGCGVPDQSQCPQDNTGGKEDCFRCEHFKCDDPHNCTAENKKELVVADADDADAGDGEASGGEAEVA